MALLIFLMALGYTILIIRWSLGAGRLSMDSVADDVVYLTDGLNRLNTFREHGLWALLNSLWIRPPHSP